MADSKRLTILKALTTMLREITEENGYQHNIQNVVRGYRSISSDEVDLPFISIIESTEFDGGPETKSDSRVVIQESEWPLIIQGWAKDDALNPSDPAHQLMADIRKRLARIYLFNSGEPIFALVKKVSVGDCVVIPAEKSTEKACCLIKVVLSITEDLLNPYNLS